MVFIIWQPQTRLEKVNTEQRLQDLKKIVLDWLTAKLNFWIITLMKRLHAICCRCAPAIAQNPQHQN